MKLKMDQMLQWRKALFVAMVVAIPLLMTGCVGVIEADIALYSGEEWEADIDLILTEQDVSMAGGEAAIEAELRRQAAQLKQQDVRYSWRREREEGNVVYHLSVEGEGWPALNQAVFNNQAQIQSTEAGHVYFSYTPMFAARAFTLRLRGGEILSSNADEVRGGTATWYNVVSTGYAEATLTEAARSPLPCLGSVGSMVLLALICLYTLRPRTCSHWGNFDICSHLLG